MTNGPTAGNKICDVGGRDRSYDYGRDAKGACSGSIGCIPHSITAYWTTGCGSRQHGADLTVHGIARRYHFCGGKGVFWARLPYMNKDLGAGAHASRFVGLAAVGEQGWTEARYSNLCWQRLLRPCLVRACKLSLQGSRTVSGH